MIESPSKMFERDLLMLRRRLLLGDSEYREACGQASSLEDAAARDERRRAATDRIERDQVQPAVEYWTAHGLWENDPRPWMRAGQPRAPRLAANRTQRQQEV